MTSLKSISAAAALLLLTSVTAVANDANATESTVCSTGSSALFRYAGPAGKQVRIPQRATRLDKCSTRTRSALVLASFVDAPGGTSLVAGRAERAVRQIGEQPKNAAELTNLCVAHTSLREWSVAKEVCDGAVTAANRELKSAGTWPSTQRDFAKKRVAVAYSNRAVMHWLSLDTGAAQGDLARARAMAPKAKFVVRNSELTVRVPAQVLLPLDPYTIG